MVVSSGVEEEDSSGISSGGGEQHAAAADEGKPLTEDGLGEGTNSGGPWVKGYALAGNYVGNGSLFIPFSNIDGAT